MQTASTKKRPLGRFSTFATRSLASLMVVAASSTAAVAAMSPFTFNPAAVGLSGSSVTADNILVSDFANVTQTGATTFSEQGFLSVTGFQLGGTNVVAGGLNSTYSIYVPFTATGHTILNPGANPNTTVTAGVLDTLTYSFVAAPSNSTFGFIGTTPTVNSTPPQQTLATGSLINGNTVTSPANGNTAFVPSANATLTFVQAAGKEGFFSPQPFYTTLFSAFTNTVPSVTATGTGFTITNGGGALNFASAVPEPETYAMILAGLGLMGFVAKRRGKIG